MAGTQGGFCGGGPGANQSSFGLTLPTTTFRTGTITDISTTLRVKGSRARDVVETSSETLTFDPRRR